MGKTTSPLAERDRRERALYDYIYAALDESIAEMLGQIERIADDDGPILSAAAKRALSHLERSMRGAARTLARAFRVHPGPYAELIHYLHTAEGTHDDCPCDWCRQQRTPDETAITL